MDEDLDQYSLESDSDLNEEEKGILEKVRKGRREENYDSEDEVLGFGSDFDEEEDEDGMDLEEEDDHDSLESDIEGLKDDEDDLPDEKAWGKKKKEYYSTDYVDPDYSTLDERKKALAKMEEEEARKIQSRLIEQLDDMDFGLDMIIGKKDDAEEDKGDEEKEVVKADLSKLGKRQKLQLLEKESPEFFLLLNDFKARLTEVTETIKPFLDMIKRKEVEDNESVFFIKSKYQLLRNYFINLTFYMMLKAKRLPTGSHPVIKRLAENRYWLTQFDEKQGTLLENINEILEADKQGKPIYNI